MAALARLTRLVAALVVAALLGACATIPPGAGSNPADPWEVYNRQMFDLNDRLDRAIMKPIAQAYEKVLPQPLRICINNAFRNLAEPVNAINNLLQGKPLDAFMDMCRFAVNSTMGLLGCFDIATDGGLAPRSNEDFGQTLGRWGFGAGPYFVLPLLGPSTVRDTVGKLIDFLDLDPVWYIENIPLRNSLVGLRLVDTRASVLPAEKLLDAAAIDRYEFIRDAFLQLRRNLVYDGNPPRLLDPDEEDDAAPKSDAGTSTLLAGQSEEPVRP